MSHENAYVSCIFAMNTELREKTYILGGMIKQSRG